MEALSEESRGIQDDPANLESWHDITTEFNELTSQLNLGELIKPESFTLLEAMSAIELMDPRMDTGTILNKTKREILSFDQAVKANKIKIINLELTELLGIIDDTYACIATWLDGHSMSQTIMTNLYLHDTEKIEDRCLKIYCQASSKLVEIMDKTIGLVYCIEEEDFVLNNNRFRLAYHLNDQKVLNALGELCHSYEKAFDEIDKPNMHNSKQKVSNSSAKSQTCQDLGPFDKSQKFLLRGLIVRLKFTHSFLACFINISKNLLKDKLVMTPQNTQALAQKIRKSLQSTTTVCDKYLEECLKLLCDWKDTIHSGLKPKTKNDDHLEGDYPTIMGFDPLINHKIMPPAYPRCLSIKSRPDTLGYLSDVMVKIRRCIAISNEFNHHKSFIKRVEALEHFSKYFEPRSCVISRSFLQTLCLPNRVAILLKEEILDSMSDYCEPVAEQFKLEETKSTALNEFLDESAKLFFQISTIYGHNPARQYDEYTEIIQSFRNLQYSAFVLGEALGNTMVYSWTTYYFVKFCLKYVLSGLELELFSPHEYPYLFWYIYDVLLRNEREQLETGKKMALAAVEQKMSTEVSGENGGKHNGRRTKTKMRKRLIKLDTMVEEFHDKSLRTSEAFGHLTHGLFLLTSGLSHQGVIKTPSYEFTDERICFEHRFNIITGGTSLYNSYLQASHLTLVHQKPDNIYKAAHLEFMRAQKSFETCGDQPKCLAVSKANQIVAKILSMNPDTILDRQVEFCFDRHPSLPIIKF